MGTEVYRGAQKRAALRSGLDSLTVLRRVDSLRLESERMTWRQQVAREMRLAQAAEAEARARQQASDRATRDLRTVRRQLDVARSLPDSVVALVATVAAQDTVIAALHAERYSLRAAIAAEQQHSATLTLALASADSATDRAMRRAGELDSLVRSRLAPPAEKRLLGFLPRPGRGLTFAVGAVAGYLLHGATR